MPRPVRPLSQWSIIADLRRDVDRLRLRSPSQQVIFTHDTFTAAGTPSTTYPLTYLPTDGSVLLAKQGLVLREGTDYTVDGTTGIVTVTASQTSGDQIVFRYATTGELIANNATVETDTITDNFNGADHSALGATSDGKATWTIEAGTWEHLSNQAHMTAGGVNGYAVASVPGTSADGTVQVSANNQHQGLAFRIVDGAHFYLATMGTLYKVAAGTFTVLATTGGVNGTPFSVEMSGSSIVVKQGGGVLASVTDTTYTSTKHGIYSDRNFAADLLEDFSWIEG